MKITSIKAQVKNPGRYSIFVDGEYAFSLSDQALLDSKLVNNQEIDDRQVEKYKKLSVDDKLYNQTLRYIALRPRSEWEIENYLKWKKTEPEVSERIIDKLRARQLLDDLAFATSWVSSRRLLKPLSRRRLTQELRQKRIGDDIIDTVLAEDETDDHTTLNDLIAKKRRQTKYQDELKLMQFLSRQGYNYDDIKSALRGDDD